MVKEQISLNKQTLLYAGNLEVLNIPIVTIKHIKINVL